MDRESAQNAVKLNKKSLADQIFAVLRERIINLEISPGEQIDVDALTEEFEVSRAPVRDAMKALEDRGLVSIEPRVGYYARKLTPSDIKELYDMRELFELYAIREVIDNVPKSLIEECRKDTLEIKKNNLNEREKRDWFDRTDEILHQKILLKNSNNNFLRDFTSRIHDLISLTRHLNKRISESAKEHLVILDALERKDEDDARESLQHHLRQVRQETLRSISEDYNDL